MSGRTPGPWEIRPLEFDDWGVIRGPVGEDGKQWMVARAYGGRSVTFEEQNECRKNGTDPYESNARFIAAAPKLYAALVRLLATIDRGNAATHDPGCGCVIHEAEAALAKAGAQ